MTDKENNVANVKVLVQFYLYRLRLLEDALRIRTGPVLMQRLVN